MRKLHSLEELTDFLLKHIKYDDRELIIKYLKEHEKYGTIDYAIDDRNNIVAVVRFNVTDEGKTASILDFAIKREYRNSGVGKDFILRAMKKFPDITYLEFKRGARGDERIRKVKISGILKRNIF